MQEGNKFKVLGAALMVSVLALILGSYQLGLTDIKVMASDHAHFWHTLGLLGVILFGSFAALTLDKQKEAIPLS